MEIFQKLLDILDNIIYMVSEIVNIRSRNEKKQKCM